MSFIAGIISLNLSLDPGDRERFFHACKAIANRFAWPHEYIRKDNTILIRAGFPHMWQGSKLYTTGDMDAVASGVQWQRIQTHPSAIDYLIENLTNDSPSLDNYFDTFNCAIVDRRHNTFVLASDPLGMSPIYYINRQDSLIFSTHQIFLKMLSGPKVEADWQGVLEYLVIGHNIGNKTLIQGVNALAPGCRLLGYSDRSIIEKPYIDTGPIEVQDISCASAARQIFDHLENKRRHYQDMSSKPIAGLLSGGWDSRLIIGLFSRSDVVSMTFTSQQKTRVQKRLISEKKIAKEVAQFLGIRNKFVLPRYRTTRNYHKRAEILDYSTWFHDWAFSLSDHLPYDKYIFCDGLLGDILIRGLYITPALRQCIIEHDKNKASHLLYSRYINGFNTYTRGIKRWESLIQADILEVFSRKLIADISRQVSENLHADFITPFLVKNRTYRGISPLPRNIIGRKGGIIYPFCDYDFYRLNLSIPIGMRCNPEFYKTVLDLARPGLSALPSTNEKDLSQLESYVLDTISDLSPAGELLRKGVPGFRSKTQILRAYLNDLQQRKWIKEVIAHPPHSMMKILKPEIQDAISHSKTDDLLDHHYLLERIMILDSFFSG